MTGKVKHLLLCVLAGWWLDTASTWLATAQSLPTTLASEYGIDRWGEPEGLVQPRLRAILQTRDGYLWLGTSGGLVRFDGLNFVSFTLQNGSLRENIVTALLEDQTAGLWIGTAGGGLSLFKEGRFRVFGPADGLPDDQVRTLDLDRAGNLWILTQQGLCRYANGQFTTFGSKEGLPAGPLDGICARAAEGVFVSAGQDLFRLSDGKFRVQTAVITLHESRCMFLTSTRDGALWLAFENGILKRWQDGVLTTYTRKNGLAARTSVIYQDPQGAVWAGAGDGLRKLNGSIFEKISFKNDKAKLGTIWSLCSDREGSLWVGSESDGLTRLRSARVTSLTAEDGLPDDSTRAIFRDSRDRVWIGTATGLAKIENQATVCYSEADGEHLEGVNAIGEDREGNVWFGAAGRLFIASNERINQYAPWKRTSDVRIIYADPLGRMWIGTDGDGLFKIEKGVISSYGVKDGLASNQIRALHYDRGGRLWVGTYKGLCKFQDGRFAPCTALEGNNGSRVLDIHESADGTLWFASRNGLGRLNDGHFHNFTAKEGMFATFPYCILEDNGYLWFSCAQGIFQVNQSELEKVASGKANRVSPFSLGIRDGLRSTAFTAGNHPIALKTSGGRLLFCSLKGVAVVDPARLSTNTLVPPVVIQSVIINKKEQFVSSQPSIPPGEGNVEIQYAGLSFLNPAKVQYRYKLEGFDPEWVDAGSRRFVYYANLPPGNYQFRVTACNNDGAWNQAGRTFPFTLRPHFYQTTWFACLSVACAIGLMATFFRWRTLRMERREKKLQQRIAEEVAKVNILSGLLPICANCKKVRDDMGYWNQIESYVTKHSEIELSHGICPDCMKKLYPGIMEEPGDETDAPNPPE